MDKLTPQELKKLEVSQERAAHYVRKKKIAEEVAKRVEAGEDPVAANEAVLAGLAPPKKEMKASAFKKDSTAADPTPSTQRPAGKRKRRASVQTVEPLEGNEISVDSADNIADPPITLSEATTHLGNGNTVIATDFPDLLPRAISRQLDAAVEAVTLKDDGTQPTDISSRPPKKRKKSLKVGVNTTDMAATPRTKIKDHKTAVYQALAQDIARIDCGIGIGPHATRSLGRGRPRKVRLAIIKSTRLIELHLLEEKPEPSVEAATVGISVTSTSHVLEAYPTSTVTAKPVQQPLHRPSITSSNYVSPYGPISNKIAPTPFPEYVSPYAPKTGEKRKRTPSSALETGFSGPRRGFFKIAPLAIGSNTARRLVVLPAQRLKSPVTQHTSISDGQPALEYVTEKVVDAAQLDTIQNKGVINQFAKLDTDPCRPIVEPMEDSMQITSASEEHSAFKLTSADLTHNRRSNSQSTIIDPDFVEDTSEPEHIAPVDKTSVGMDPATIDNSIALLGDPYSAGRTLGDPQPDDLTDTQVASNGQNSKSQGDATDSNVEERDRSAGETRLVEEQNRRVGPRVVNESLGIIGDSKAPGPHSNEGQPDKQVAVNGDSTDLEGTATESVLVDNKRNSDEIGLIGEQNDGSEPTAVDIFADVLIGNSDISGLLSQGKQPDDLPAQRPGLHVQSQSTLETLEDGSPDRQNMPLGGVSLLESIDDKQVDADSQLVPDDGLPRIINVHDADEDSSVKGSPKTKSSKVITRLTPNSGSIGVLRQKIIIEIVEACGGVFPGDKELWYPFTTAWLQRMPPGTGKPDNRTIKTAKKALIASGKLRQLRFAFLNKHGVMVEKGMVTTNDVHSNSPIVKDLQRKMIEQDPWLYVPQEAAVADDLRKSHTSAVVFGTNKTTAQLEVDEETQVELQYVPAYVKRAAINKEAAAAKKRATAEMRRPALEEKRRMRAQERLQALEEKRRAREEELQKLLGVPDFAIDGYRSADVVMESEKEGASEFMAFEGASPPPVRRPGRPPGPQKEGTRPKVQRLARLGRPSPSRPLRTLLPQPSSALPAQSGEAGSLSDGHRMILKSAMEQFALDSSFRTTLRPRQRVDYAAINRGKTPPSEEQQFGMWTPANSDISQRLRFTKPLGLDSIYDRAPSPNFEVGRLFTLQDRAKPTFPFDMQLELPQFDSSYRYQRVSTFMDPDYYFHALTGTYSVTFSVLRNVRLGLGINTKSEAYNEPALPDISAKTSSQSFKHDVPNRLGPLPEGKSLFHSEIDDMLLTELNTPNLDAPVSKNLLFINHVMPHPHFVAERPIKISTKRPRLAKALSAWPNKPNRFASGAMPPPANSKLIVLKLAAHHLASLSDRPPAPKLLRLEDTKICYDMTGRPLRRARVPGSERLSKYMSLAMERRLMTAVVVIRTLTGGLEGNLDWNIVAPIFQSTFTAAFIHNRWASLRIKYQIRIERMQADFQDLFARAYEDNLVPPLDFSNIEGYDWAWLVDWTQRHLEFPSSYIISELPMNRAQLDDRYDLRQSKEVDLPEYFFSLDPTHTFVRRRARLHREPMVAPLTLKSRKSQGEDRELLEVARNWVRANVITLDTVYSPTLAHQKLTSLPESSISTALRSLRFDRVIAQVGKGRLVPGRNYSLSDFFFTRLKKSLEVSQLQRATLYKLELDRSIAEHGKAEISYHADDGNMLALTNLVAHRRINLVPRDPPMEKFGLVDGGYKTRFMDKSRLTFAVDIVPTARYIPGLPSLPPPPVPPTTNPNDPRAKLPVWIDIHGNFVREMWQLALAAVLSLVTLRPGMGAQEVAGSVAPCLGRWEVESLLGWLVQAGVAGWTEGGSVLVGEGWWGVFGGEGGGKGKEREREEFRGA